MGAWANDDDDDDDDVSFTNLENPEVSLPNHPCLPTWAPKDGADS